MKFLPSFIKFPALLKVTPTSIALIHKLKREFCLRSPMQVTATGHLREYLRVTLPEFTEPILLIYPRSYSGCPQCHSEITIYRVEITERSDPALPPDLHRVENHKFPISVYFIPAPGAPTPTGVILGTRSEGAGYEMMVRRVTYLEKSLKWP